MSGGQTVRYSNGGLNTGLKKSCLWSTMSGIGMVGQVLWLYHLNARLPKCLVVFRWHLDSYYTVGIQKPDVSRFWMADHVQIWNGFSYFKWLLKSGRPPFENQTFLSCFPRVGFRIPTVPVLFPFEVRGHNFLSKEVKHAWSQQATDWLIFSRINYAIKFLGHKLLV